MKKTLTSLVTFAALTMTPAVMADEQYFGYTYPAEGLPKGAFEIYQWTTYKTGREGKPDTAINMQTEIEYGVTDRLAASFYLDYGYFDNGNDLEFTGLRTAWKYFFKTVAKDDYGLGIYFEPIWARTSSTSGNREDKWALEGKVLFQKNFLDDQIVWATNLTTEFEWERYPGESWEKVLELKASTGVSYQLFDHWGIGIEGLYETEFEGFSLEDQEKWMIAVGPTVRYRNGPYWATLTWLPQVVGNPSTAGSRNLAGYDEHQIRLKCGINF